MPAFRRLSCLGVPGAFGERCDEAVEADRIDCISALHVLEDLHSLSMLVECGQKMDQRER